MECKSDSQDKTLKVVDNFRYVISALNKTSQGINVYPPCTNYTCNYYRNALSASQCTQCAATGRRCCTLPSPTAFVICISCRNLHFVSSLCLFLLLSWKKKTKEGEKMEEKIRDRTDIHLWRIRGRIRRRTDIHSKVPVGSAV